MRRGSRPPPTGPGWPRSRTRCRRDGRRWPGRARAPGGRRWAAPSASRSPTGRPLASGGPGASVTRAGRTGDGRHRDHVARLVDVPRQVGTVEDVHRQPDALGLGAVAGERAGTVGEAEAGGAGDGDDVGAVAEPVGHQGDPGGVAHRGQLGGAGQVGVGHRHLLDAAGPQVGHPGLDGAVQAPSRLPDDQGTPEAGPLGHLAVVAHHRHREGGGGGAPHGRPWPGPAPTVRRRRAPGPRRRLASAKAFTGMSTIRAPNGVGVGGRRSSVGACHRPSVGVSRAPTPAGAGRRPRVGACRRRSRSSAPGRGGPPWRH